MHRGHGRLGNTNPAPQDFHDGGYTVGCAAAAGNYLFVSIADIDSMHHGGDIIVFCRADRKTRFAPAA